MDLRWSYFPTPISYANGNIWLSDVNGPSPGGHNENGHFVVNTPNQVDSPSADSTYYIGAVLNNENLDTSGRQISLQIVFFLFDAGTGFPILAATDSRVLTGPNILSPNSAAVWNSQPNLRSLRDAGKLGSASHFCLVAIFQVQDELGNWIENPYFFTTGKPKPLAIVDSGNRYVAQRNIVITGTSAGRMGPKALQASTTVLATLQRSPYNGLIGTSFYNLANQPIIGNFAM